MFLKLLFYIIIAVILIRVLWFFIRLFWNAYKLRRFMRDPFAEMRRQAQQEYKRQQERYGQAAPQPQPSHKQKKLDPSVGEYIAFTDIEVTQTASNPDSGTTTTTTYHEQQITDIEWEDVE